ncbi:CAAX prenyl protease 1 [Diutina catenulata]
MAGFESIVNGIEPNSWKSILIGISATKYIFLQYLDYREYKVHRRTTPPAAVRAVVDEEKYAQAQDFGRAHKKWEFLDSASDVLCSIGMIYFNVYRKIWNWAGAAVAALGLRGTTAAASATVLGVAGGTLSGMILQSVLFFLINFTIITLVELPAHVYATFSVEERFGFNKQTPGKYVKLKLGNFLVSSVIHSGLFAGLLKIVDYTGTSFVPYATLGFVGFMVFINTISGPLIQPLFMKRTPLVESKLRDLISEFAGSVGFPMDEIYIVEGSSITTHGNAYFTGMPWKKSICLFDTLIDQLTEQEVLAVVAHKICHWKRMDTAKMMLEKIVSFAAMVKVFEAFIFSKGFYEGFGFSVGLQPVIVGVYLFSYLTQADVLTDFVLRKIARSREYQADQYAKDRGYGDELCSGLIKMYSHNLKGIDTDWLYSMYCYKHPSLLERLDALGYKPKAE